VQATRVATVGRAAKHEEGVAAKAVASRAV